MFIGILGKKKNLENSDIVNMCYEFTKIVVRRDESVGGDYGE